MAYAVYARQSVEKKNSISIEGQIQLCETTAGQPLLIYADRGYSGKNTQRPAFQRLMKDIEARKIEKLYVYRLDRFSRSVADFGRLWETLKACNVEFVSVNENFDTSTPMGRAMLHIIMVFAQLERETTAERVKDNYYRRASLGSWPGGPAPYGFTIGRCQDATGRMVPTLVMEPTQAATVMEIFRSYAEPGATLGTVSRKLTEDGVPSAKRESWDNVAVSRVLHNPAYVMADEQVRLHYLALGANITSPPEAFDGEHGLLLVGKRDRAQKKYTDVHDHSISVMNSLGFIPAQLYLACQNKLSRNRQLHSSGKGTHSWLTGLMKCAKCGYSVRITYAKQHRYLQCSARYGRKICNAVITADLTELEEIIAAQIQAMLDECPEEQTAAANPDPYVAQLEELDRRADRLMDAFAGDDSLSPAYLHRALARIEDERAQILAARKRENNRPVFPAKLLFSGLPFEDRKAVAAQFIRRIEIDGENVEVIWNV